MPEAESARLNGGSPRDPTAAERARRYRARQKGAAARRTASVMRVSPAGVPTTVTAETSTLAAVRTAVTPSTSVTARSSTVTLAALVSAVSLASVSAFFGVVGMTAIFAAAALPVMVMVGVLEAAKLVTCAWLARHWRVTPLLLRAPLAVMVLALMTVTAIGSYGFLARAHLQHQVAAQQTVDRDAAPIAQRRPRP